jgi:hypothetical protein
LRLEFYSCNQLAITDDEEIPFFGRTKEPREFQGLAKEDVLGRDAGVNKQIRDKLAKAEVTAPRAPWSARPFSFCFSLCLWRARQ